MPEIDLKAVKAQLDELKGYFEALGTTPPPSVVQGVNDQSTDEGPSRKIMTRSEVFEVREALRKKSNSELLAMFDMQLTDGSRKGVGIPLDVWQATAGGQALSAGLLSSPEITKALDSGSGSALIRQDLEPVMYELFVREFPAFDRLPKEPANGLVHAFNQVTSFGDAQFLSELGTVTDDQGTYVRQTTNVAILATRRGVSLKSQFAALQSGAGFNPENLELQGGMRAIAHKMQQTIFQGNATVSSGTASTEDGAYDPNSFDGLRKLLNTSRAVDVDPTASTPEDMRAAIDSALLEALNNGGTTSMLYMRPNEKLTFDLQQDKNVQIIDRLTNYNVGVNISGVNTVFGLMPIQTVPGDSIGTYTRSATLRADIYAIDERTLTIPYLGSPGPTVLDIPIGISGQLTHLYIIFGMWGLALKAPIFSNKIRVKVTA
jgi:hypothetical protein